MINSLVFGKTAKGPKDSLGMDYCFSRRVIALHSFAMAMQQHEDACMSICICMAAIHAKNSVAFVLITTQGHVEPYCLTLGLSMKCNDVAEIYSIYYHLHVVTLPNVEHCSCTKLKKTHPDESFVSRPSFQRQLNWSWKTGQMIVFL